MSSPELGLVWEALVFVTHFFARVKGLGFPIIRYGSQYEHYPALACPRRKTCNAFSTRPSSLSAIACD